MSEDKNVYGENHPKEEDVSQEEGIREKVAEKDKGKNKSTAEDLDETRRQMSQSGQTGGMGREGTPKPEGTQGTWNRPDEE